MTTNNELSVLNNILDSIVIDTDRQESLRFLAKSGYTPEVDAKAFRWIELTKNKTLQWYQPGQLKNDVVIEEIPGSFYAVKGYIVKISAGFSMFAPDTGVAKDTEDKVRGPVCKTVSAVAFDENSRIVNSDRPFWFPIGYGPNNYNTNTPISEIEQFKPMGSRGMLCSDCVSAGKHFMKDGKDTSQCGLSARVLFVVTQLAKVEKDFAKNSYNVVWKNVTDYKNDDGNQVFDRPFMLRMEIGGKSAIKISTGIQLANYKASGGYIPDTASSLFDFCQEMLKQDLVHPLKNTNNDLPLEVLWGAEVECYLTTGIHKEGRNINIPAYPLFNIGRPLTDKADFEVPISVYSTERAQFKQANNITSEQLYLTSRPAPLSAFQATGALPPGASTTTTATNGNGNGNSNSNASVVDVSSIPTPLPADESAPINFYARAKYTDSDIEKLPY